MRSDRAWESRATSESAIAGYDPRTLLVHVHISRTGGSTLNHILRSSFGPRHCPVEPWDSRWGADPFTVSDLRRLRRLYPSLKSIAGHRVYGYVDLEDQGIGAAYFAMVRDPLRACASRFQHKVEKTGKDFSEFESWIQKEWVRNRHVRAISGTEDVSEAIRIIRQKGIFMGLTERYDESAILLKTLVAPDLNISYKPVNVARKRTVSQQLLSEPRYRDMIQEAQAADLELYRFVKEELWPEYEADYPGELAADAASFAADRGDFDMMNIILSRAKAYSIYKPALFLHRNLRK